mmetsp:Transcript_80268/g.167088  ORF Transcript_80268/g.167088 Transcript_80268/m.167088 type:complete len:96 (+) Transcript_80268:98-385(+)
MEGEEGKQRKLSLAHLLLQNFSVRGGPKIDTYFRDLLQGESESAVPPGQFTETLLMRGERHTESSCQEPNMVILDDRGSPGMTEICREGARDQHT